MGEFSKEFDALLKACPNSVRGLFIARLRGLHKPGRQRRDAPQIEQRIRSEMQAAIDSHKDRLQCVPAISYPPDLPVSAKRDEIMAAINEHQVVIVCGQTGSGKTTQIPKMCLELGRGVDGLIGHTQPRRIAARTVASRIAEELSVPLGQQVGFKVRFGDGTSEKTLVKVMTDGILLAETRSDRKLHRYDTIIIDEAHERSLNIDFLLGYMHTLLPKRKDLKLIITSATIDAERFADHFATHAAPAPIIEVSGRTYPVEMRYDPDLVLSGVGIDEAAAVASTQLVNEGHADVLIFMPGEREIRMTAHALRKQDSLPERVEILPLYARLSASEQQRVFRPKGAPRIVIATNVAETSLTVPGIRSVVDPGVARLKRYNTRTKIQGLQVEPISQASANQRAGRCGRVAPGICIRLFAETDLESREEFTQPEILRTNLASVILQMVDLKLGAPSEFPFLDCPDNRQWRDGHETLRELGAIDDQDQLTKVGRVMAKLPVDPRVARMVIAGHEEHCLHEVLIIAAALSTQDPRVRPHDKRDAADQAHQQFKVEGSDFLSYLRIWDWYHDQWKDLSRRKLAKACEKNYLAPRRIDEWREVYRQLRSMSIELKFDPEKTSDDSDAIHRALLCGLLANIGTKGERFEYNGTRTTSFSINPGSSVFKTKPKWVMSAEIVRTTKVYARTLAKIEPKWIEDAAAHLIKRTHSGARWDEKTARVIADEKVTLFGLDIIPRRTVHFGPVDPVESRSLFIHHALIEGEFSSRSKAVKENRTLLDTVRTLEAKARRGDLIADTQAMHSFYDHRLPEDVYSGNSFDRWAAKMETENPGLLRMRESDLLESSAQEVTPISHPDRISFDTLNANVSYAYEPGETHDGASIRVSVSQLHQLSQEQVDWAVPGFLPARIEALIRTLPKHLRRQFDAAKVGNDLGNKLTQGESSIEVQLAQKLSEMTGTFVRPDDFRASEVPEHVHPRVEVVDSKGKAVGEGRQIRSLQRQFRGEATQSVKAVSEKVERSGITSWDFGELKETVQFQSKGKPSVTGFPALAIDGKSVRMLACSTKRDAELHTRPAIGLLYGLAIKHELRLRVKSLPGYTPLAMLGAACSAGAEMESIVLCRTGLAACVEGFAIVRTQEAFDERLPRAYDNGLETCQQSISNLGKIFDGFVRVRNRLDRGLPKDWHATANEIEAQLQLLTPDGYLLETPTNWLWSYPRYLKGIEVRLDRIRTGGIQKDRKLAGLVGPWVQCLGELYAQDAHLGAVAEEFATLRWMVEELRIATFAQELRTVMPVSDKRLRIQLDKIVHG
ncbi:MAG: ATP-dependent RNA helicase HrpA [Phycisphaerales bacterium]|nr:ATP-dependent RNA helicase HrpA [Phycisphaerales bacterium]